MRLHTYPVFRKQFCVNKSLNYYDMLIHLLVFHIHLTYSISSRCIHHDLIGNTKRDNSISKMYVFKFYGLIKLVRIIKNEQHVKIPVIRYINETLFHLKI